jgi:Amidohydrolase
LNQKAKYFDCHFHIIDKNFPVVPNQGFVPDAFTSEDYLARLKAVDLCGGAVVSGSFQAFDQSYLFHALKVLGPSFVGVSQVPQTVSDQELQELNSAGVRAVRFNVKRGGSEEIHHLESMARRVHQLVGWHTELYVDSAELADLFETLVSLPAVSIDHLGLSKAGFPTLLKLAEKGVRVKATGFGRVDFDVRPALTDLYAANPRGRSCSAPTCHPHARRGAIKMTITRWFWKHWEKKRRRMSSTKTRLSFIGQRGLVIGRS